MRVVSFLCVGAQPWAARMVASAKTVLHLPVVQMSDADTPPVAGVDEVVRRPMTGKLMPFRLEHLAAYPHEEMLILDADVLVKRGVEDIWRRPFDVALTRRGSVMDPDGNDVGARMPYNTGVMFSRSQAFWKNALNALMGMGVQCHEWYGDQLAVYEVVKTRRYHVLSLNAEEFNWTPETPDEISEARFWHYKGAKRKQWIDGPQVG